MHVCAAAVTMLPCVVLDARSGTALQTEGDPSSFPRTRRDQQSPHREAEGGVDISPLPDNMTRMVVRQLTQ